MDILIGKNGVAAMFNSLNPCALVGSDNGYFKKDPDAEGGYPPNPAYSQQRAAANDSLLHEERAVSKYQLLPHILPPVTPAELKIKPLEAKSFLVNNFRDVQKAMFKGAMDAIKNGSKSPLVWAPCRAGKTIFSRSVVYGTIEKHRNRRVFFFCHTEKILEQTVADFSEWFDVGVIKALDARTDLSKQVQILTYQTYQHRLEDKDPAVAVMFESLNPILAFYDEAHKQFKVRERVGADISIGLTGSPYADRMGDFYDYLVPTTPAKKLEQQGVLVPLKVYHFSQASTDGMTIGKDGEYVKGEEAKQCDYFIGDMVKHYKTLPYCKGRKFIVATRSIETCNTIAKLFMDAGVRVGVVHSEVKDNKPTFDSLESGDIDGIVSVAMLIEGVNLPCASLLFCARAFAPSKKDESEPNSLCNYVQLLNRIRTAHEGKEDGVMIDYFGAFEQYGHPDIYEEGFTKLHKSGDKKELKPAARMKREVQCPECPSMIPANVCLDCGFELEKYTKIHMGELVRVVDGKIYPLTEGGKEVRPKKKDLSPEEKQLFINNMRWHAENVVKPRIEEREKRQWNKARGYVFNSYKAKFKKQPQSFMLDQSIPIKPEKGSPAFNEITRQAMAAKFAKRKVAA